MPEPAVVELPAVDPEEPAPRLLADLHTRRDGLAQREAERRLQQIGPNTIKREERPGALIEIARQLSHPLALLLWAAAGLAMLSDTAALAAAIVGVIFLNALFSFVQESARPSERPRLCASSCPRGRGCAATASPTRSTPPNWCQATCSCCPKATACPPMRGSSPGPWRSTSRP